MPKQAKSQPVLYGEKLGLVCRKCGCQHFRVIYLKRLPQGVVMRRRECRHCGRRVSTREQAL